MFEPVLIHLFCRSKVTRFLLAIFLLGLSANPSSASYSGSYPSWEYFRSTDMTPVPIRLDPRKSPDDEPVSFNLPRAFIIFSPEYPIKQFRTVPYQVSGRVHIAIDLESNGPMNMLVDSKKDFSVGADGIPDWRRNFVKVEIGKIIRQEAYRESRDYERMRGEKLNEFDGLYQYKLGGGVKFFGRDGIDRFEAIRCFERGTPGHFCTYYSVLADNVLLITNFLDFRFHGGAAFANARITEIHQLLCRYYAGECADRRDDGGPVPLLPTKRQVESPRDRYCREQAEKNVGVVPPKPSPPKVTVPSFCKTTAKD